jgi:hypothetical protein
MPTIEQVTLYLTAGITALVTISVPLGLLGSLVELFGARFGLPKVEMIGDKIEKFFFDLPGLLTRKPAAIKAKAPKVPLPVLLLGVVLLLPGCSLFRGPGVDWPKVAECAAPLAEAELDAVKRILHGDGNVREQLEGLAVQYAPATILCAVERLVEGLFGSSQADLRAKARGQAFLAEVQPQ